MTTTKLATVAAVAVLLAAALGLATFEIQAQRRAVTALAVATRNLEREVAGRLELEGRVRAAEQAAVEVRTEVEGAHAAEVAAGKGAIAGSAGPVSASATAWDPVQQGDIFMARHPAVRQVLDDYAKARTRFRYAALIKSLNLSAEKADELLSLLSRGFGMGAPGIGGPYANQGLTLFSGPRPSAGEAMERLRELIGESGLVQFVEIRRLEAARELTSKVAGELWSTEAPLTPPQSNDLIRILAEHRSSKAAMAGSQIAGYDWSAILDEARRFLAEPQLAILSGMQAREQFTQALNRRPPSGSAGTSGANPLPPR